MIVKLHPSLTYAQLKKFFGLSATRKLRVVKGNQPPIKTAGQ